MRHHAASTRSRPKRHAPVLNVTFVDLRALESGAVRHVHAEQYIGLRAVSVVVRENFSAVFRRHAHGERRIERTRPGPDSPTSKLADGEDLERE